MFLAPILATSDLTGAIQDARARTLAMVGDLDDDQLSVPRLDIVNPFLWELGHVAHFYDAFVLRQLGCPPLLDRADDLYDSFTVDHRDRWQLELPDRAGTLAYLQRTLDAAGDLLASRTPGQRETYLVQLAVLHEDMHGEAFCYMRQALGYPAPDLGRHASTDADRAGPWPGDAEVPGGTFRLGAESDDVFVFDNEKWAHPVHVEPFRIARAPVTNAEFAAFVEDGGYRRRELWSRQGWRWRERGTATAPRYWRCAGRDWLRRDFDAWLPLEPHAPATHVSWYEAEAWCRWADRRLPTEAEWEMAASAEPDADGGSVPAVRRRYPWGDAEPRAGLANLESGRGSVDVAACAGGDSAFGCRQMLGNVWEWTADSFYPFPGFVVDSPYREYSAPWFGDRKVLKGGAWATRARLANNRYRNFFTPDRSDVLAGFRTCAR